MKTNIGSTDKIIRIVAGAALIGWGVMTQNLLGGTGVILVATGFMNFCPIYTLLGLSTGGKSGA